MEQPNLPVITVITPVHNGEKYVERAVRSVFNQPRKDAVCMILVNDGSTDGTHEIAERLSSEFPQLHYLKKENGGVSSARNAALELVDTKYVAFLDADDFWENGFLDDHLIDEFTGDDIDMYGFYYRQISPDLRYAYINGYGLEQDEVTTYYDHPERGRYQFKHFCSFVYSASLLKENHLTFLPCKINEDQPFVEMCFYLAKSYRCCRKIIFSYWSNTNSCLHTTNYMTYFNNKYISFEVAQAWFESRGVSYDNTYSFVMIIAELLPDLCAYNSYRFAKETIAGDRRFDVLAKYKELPLHYFKDTEKTIHGWMEHPRRFFWHCRLVYRPTMALKKFFYRHPLLRRLPDSFFYRRRGYSRVDPSLFQ